MVLTKYHFFLNYIFIVYLFYVTNLSIFFYNFGQTWESLKFLEWLIIYTI